MADRYARAPVRYMLRILALVATLAMLAACTTGNDAADRQPAAPGGQAAADREPDDTLTVYSRDREFAEPLFERFTQQTRIRIRARWGDPIDLADQIIADGATSPADVFYGPLSDALGKLNAAGRLTTLTDKQLGRVPRAYRSPEGTWVGTSGRAHAVFYNTDKLTADDLPDSILGFTDPAWRARIGWDPTSRSLQDVITELTQLDGADAARQWLRGMQANTPAAIRGTMPIINAVAAGQLVQVGFGSHSYLDYQHADGEATNVAAKFYTGGAPGGLLNVAGVGIIKGSNKFAAASTFVDFMLSRTVQQYLASNAYEIPLIEGGVELPEGTPNAAELAVPGLDLRQFEELQPARRQLTDAGIIG
jgi:iron(III) transport system substrate-binding protein